MKNIILLLLILFTAVCYASAQQSEDDTNGDGSPDRWVTINAGLVSEVSLDRDYNGIVDYIVRYDEKSRKSEEILDFNYDGEMDDFYFYAAGTMKRREIDSNYDNKIDIWVYLDGIYIQKYEKDTDFDGQIDVTEVYTED